MTILKLDHIQFAMPARQEEAAREFYVGLLGFIEVKKPKSLARRGGCRFEQGEVKLHLGIDDEFKPARKAHPAFLVSNLAKLIDKLTQHGHEIKFDVPLSGYDRAFVTDPFGNRIELMQRTAG